MLRIFLLANCASCTVFGLLFTFWAATSAAFIGDPPVVLLRATGIILLANAALLMLTALRFADNRALIQFFVMGDAGWVLLTLALVLSGLWIGEGIATVAALAVAAMVGFFGAGQWFYGLRTAPEAP